MSDKDLDQIEAEMLGDELSQDWEVWKDKDGYLTTKKGRITDDLLVHVALWPEFGVSNMAAHETGAKWASFFMRDGIQPRLYTKNKTSFVYLTLRSAKV